MNLVLIQCCAVQMLDHEGVTQRQCNLRVGLPAPVAVYADASTAAVLNSEALTGVPTTVRLQAAVFSTFPDASPSPGTSKPPSTCG